MLKCFVEQVRRRRSAAVAMTLVIVFLGVNGAHAQLRSGLISQGEARSIGLKRSWFAHAQVDPGHSRVVHWVLSGDQLFLVTGAGAIQALDANTGQTLWTATVGNPDYPSFGPGSNDQLVALLNGSTLYLLDRKKGHLVAERRVGGAPGAGPVLSEKYVFVPLVTGRIEGYPLDEEDKWGTWFYQSFGRMLVRPRVTPENLVWVTDTGHMYVGSANNPRVRFRLESGNEFAASPAYRTPLIYVISLSGEMFAVDERTGTLRWRYVTGFPSTRAPAVVGDRVYITSDEPSLHAVDANKGIGQWEAPGITQFAATTDKHVYGFDRFGTLHVLDRTDGHVLRRVPTGGRLDALVNDQTDRLLLISDRGLVQCLHEIGADKPTYYVKLPSDAEPAAEAEPTDEYRGEGDSPAAQPTRQPAAEPREAESPFAPLPGVDADNPFGPPPAAEPAEEPAEENPFGSDDENPFAF
jgi:hypothetical protein